MYLLLTPWSHSSARSIFIFTYVIYAYLRLCGGLHEGTVVELPRHVEALVLADDALVLQVALVADEHHGHVLGVLDGPKNEGWVQSVHRSRVEP